MQVLLVVFVAVVNLAVGYALAYKFGWEMIGLTRPMPEEEQDWQEDEYEDDELPFQSPDVGSTAVVETLFHEQAETTAAIAAEEPPPVKGFLTETADGFLARLADFTLSLAATDTQLRQEDATADPGAVEQVRTTLSAAVKEYLAKQQDGNNLLKDERDELGELTAIGDRLELAVDEHCELVDAARRTVDRRAVEVDAAAERQTMIDEVERMLTSCHALRDGLEAGNLDIARQEDRTESLPQSCIADRWTGLTNRAGVEACLARWWRDDPDRSQPLCLALLDVDGFERINKLYGCQIGDRVIRAMAQALRGAVPDDVASRVSGQRFALLLPGAETEDAAQVVERCRQTVEQACFQWDQTELRLTVSCVLVAANPDDTAQSLFDRAEDRFEQAKLQGRNRTVLCDQTRAEPVEPPTLDIVPQTLAV